MENSVNEIAALAIEAMGIQEVNGTPIAIVPRESRLEDLARFQDRPTRKSGVFCLNDTESFISYFKEHRLGSAIYGTRDPARFVGILNDHCKTDPGWMDHRAVYACPASKEWTIWTGNDGKKLSQRDFSEFIEDNLPDIFSDGAGKPTGAQMLEVAQSLSAKTNVNFASAVRLDNGNVQFTYEETTEAKARGQMLVPQMFFIAIPVFERGEAYEIQARLRYRISEQGALTMWYDLLRPHKVHEHAVEKVWQTIESGLDLKIYNGDAPGAK